MDRQKTFLLNNGTMAGRFREALYKLFGYAPSMVQEIQKLTPCLSHVHMGKDATLYLPVHHKLNIPLAVTFHGTDATTTDEWKKEQNRITYKIYLRKRTDLIRSADLFIAVSRSVHQGLLRQGYPEEKIFVHYIGIDLNMFSPDSAVEREPTVLFVSRLEEFKGCQYVIEAVSALQKKNPEIQLVVIGDGPYRSSLEEQAAAQQTNCRFLGMQPHTTVREWMNKARVLSVPSEREGMPTFVQEAMAMGLPMALFSIPATREALGEELKECLVEEKNVQQLTELLSAFFQHTALWEKISALGRERVQHRFNLEKQTALLEEKYALLISKAAGRKVSI
ncbi:glycosyltransferase [Candidatus Electrothrix sp.]|uniref:glycosyltransferase n=1 Tax=Candidatus Electrothrix sp. TaxID=2170559 RepID=UPI004055E71F